MRQRATEYELPTPKPAIVLHGRIAIPCRPRALVTTVSLLRTQNSNKIHVLSSLLPKTLHPCRGSENTLPQCCSSVAQGESSIAARHTLRRLFLDS